MIPEASLQLADGGLVPRGEGWFVLNARDARWLEGRFGAFTRLDGDVVYPESELARRHNAGVDGTTRDPREAYAGVPPDTAVGYRDGWLPG